jgi:hypothetical protein
MRPTHPGKRRFIWNPHPWVTDGTSSTNRVRAPKGQPVKAITGWNPGDHATQRSLCPERAPGTGCVWSPFAPLGRGGVGWGDPGFRSAPPWAIAVRRVAARAGAGCRFGGIVPKETSHSVPPGGGTRPSVGVVRHGYAGGVEAGSPGCEATPGPECSKSTYPGRGCSFPNLRTPLGCGFQRDASFPGCVLRTTRGYLLQRLRRKGTGN